MLQEITKIIESGCFWEAGIEVGLRDCQCILSVAVLFDFFHEEHVYFDLRIPFERKFKKPAVRPGL